MTNLLLKLMRDLGRTFFALAICTLGPPSVANENLINKADQSVVRVITRENFLGIPLETGWGSGVVIDRLGWVLTNQHVVSAGDTFLIEWKTRLGKIRTEPAKVIKQDKSRDLALLRVMSADLPALTFAQFSPLKSSTVYAIGFPGVADVDYNTPLESTVTQGIVSRSLDIRLTHTKVRFIQHSAIIASGSSGGPLVNSCGELVGINSLGAMDYTEQGDIYAVSGFSYAIDQAVVLNFAQKGGARPRQMDKLCVGQAEISGVAATDEQGIQSLVSPMDTEDSSIEPLDVSLNTSESGSESSSLFNMTSTIFLIFMGFVVFLGVGVVVYFVMRAQKQKRLGDEILPDSSVAWELRGITQRQKNIFFTLLKAQDTPSRPLIVGRSQSCGLVIDDPSVSRHHAKLYVDHDSLYCMDLGSTNGTKINGRILPNNAAEIMDSGVLNFGDVMFSIKRKN